MKKIKKILTLGLTVLISFTIFCSLTGCSSGEQNKKVIDENFYCKVIDENNIAIGNVKTYPKDGAVFFPEQIENYTVSKIGFASGLGFGGNGYLTAVSSNGPNIKRCYFPHTIKEVRSGYISSDLKIFYCGEVIDLIGLDAEFRDVEIYVPAEKYDLFKNALSEQYFRGSLLKANVSYHLNYDENNYYYIDYYENGEKICYIPPIPKRDGYTFGGWFKESECINAWNFEADTLPQAQYNEQEQEIYQKTKLYAKWIKA
jgi:hypothetical protein